MKFKPALFYAILANLFALATLGFTASMGHAAVGWWPVVALVGCLFSVMRTVMLAPPMEKRALANAAVLMFLAGGTFTLLGIHFVLVRGI